MHKKIYSIFLLTLLIISMAGCDNKVANGKGPGATKIQEIQNGNKTEEKKEENSKDDKKDDKKETESKEDTKKETEKTEDIKKEEKEAEKKEDEDKEEKVSCIENFLFIGDSMMNMLKPVIQKDTPSAKVEGAGGKEASYFLKRFDSLPKDGVDGIVVWIGVNGIVNKDNVKNTTELLTKLSERYPGKKIYVMKVFPVGKNWKYGNMVADEMNPGIKEFNTEIEKFVNENNMTYIDATKEFVDENGYLVGSSDDLHLFEEEDNKKILDVVKSVIEKSNK